MAFDRSVISVTHLFFSPLILFHYHSKTLQFINSFVGFIYDIKYIDYALHSIKYKYILIFVQCEPGPSTFQEAKEYLLPDLSLNGWR